MFTNKFSTSNEFSSWFSLHSDYFVFFCVFINTLHTTYTTMSDWHIIYMALLSPWNILWHIRRHKLRKLLFIYHAIYILVKFYRKMRFNYRNPYMGMQFYCNEESYTPHPPPLLLHWQQHISEIVSSLLKQKIGMIHGWGETSIVIDLPFGDPVTMSWSP